MSGRPIEERVERGVAAIRVLSREIGPRPPGSSSEESAAHFVSDELRALGLNPRIEEFRSARSFGPAYLSIFGVGAIGAAVQRIQGLRAVGHLASTAAVGVAAWEGRYPERGPLAFLRRRRSRNVSATVEPTGEIEQTVCLVSHLDSSRSGLMFHPRATQWLGALVALASVALLLQAVSLPLSRLPGLRVVDRLARLMTGMAVLLVAEREIRGEDVSGANDNASGVGACLTLADELSGTPLRQTRVVVLFTGSEESGPLGIRRFLHRHDTEGWLFINFDGVGADAPLRVLDREGGPLGSVKADPELLELAAAVGRDHPELAAAPLSNGSGLPYDSTPVLVGGGRAISVVNQDGPIPNYHWPTDRFEHISKPAFERAVRFGLELVRRIDQAGRESVR